MTRPASAFAANKTEAGPIGVGKSMITHSDRRPRPGFGLRARTAILLLGLAAGAAAADLAPAHAQSASDMVSSRIYNQGRIPAAIPPFETFWNRFGRVGAYQPRGAVVTATHPFFQALGTNGRSCATCHQPPSGMSISLRNVRARFNATEGKDPLFAPVDGANCPDAVAGSKRLRAAYSVILNRALIRMPLPWPPRKADGSAKPVEFDLAITADQDPPGCNTDAVHGVAAGIVSVYRRPPGVAQMNFKTVRSSGKGKILPGTLMWDGREASLEQQAINATRGHAQAAKDPTAEQIKQIVAFQTGIFSAQQFDRLAGRLNRDGATAGPVALSSQLPFPAGGFPFIAFQNWASGTEARASIVRGEALFNSRIFPVSGVDGFNDRSDVGGDLDEATCSSCHGVFASGGDFVPNPQMNIGVGGTGVLFGGLPAVPDLPRFTLTCDADAQPGFAGYGPIVTNDPGLALITGKCADIGKFTVPQLRALAAREPYFHDGSARTLAEVVQFYDRRFTMGLTAEEQRDLASFLAAL